MYYKLYDIEALYTQPPKNKTALSGLFHPAVLPGHCTGTVRHVHSFVPVSKRYGGDGVPNLSSPPRRSKSYVIVETDHERDVRMFSMAMRKRLE